MTRQTLLLFSLLAATACGGDDKGETDDTGAAAGGDDGTADTLWDGNNCPDEVPEEYRNLWSCKTGCDGDQVLYHWGVGSSDEDGNITVEEKWFFFDPRSDGDVDWCVDTFEITGKVSTDYSVSTFNCDSCESIFEITWDMTSGNACSLQWGYLFFGKDFKEKDPPYSGYMLMDTHNSFGDRNPDGNMIVYGYPIAGNNYFDIHQGDYGRGTALPTSDVDSIPEDYEWTSQPVCFD